MTYHVDCPNCGRPNAVESEYLPEEYEDSETKCEYCETEFTFTAVFSVTLRAT
jgi:aspartate carbamoyltransferase regulatory subunit